MALLDSLWFGIPALVLIVLGMLCYIAWQPKPKQPELKWEGQDGECGACGRLISKHPDWVLPDRVVKYCDGWKFMKLRELGIPRKHRETAWQRHAAKDICRFFRVQRDKERRRLLNETEIHSLGK